MRTRIKQGIGIFILIFLLFGILHIKPISYSLLLKEEKRIKVNLEYSKEDLYQMIASKKLNYKDKEIIEILTNWYDYFQIEDMFFTEEGEYVDYTTYQIYRVHLENQYPSNRVKILRKLLRYSNYPKQEDSALYDKYIEEYKDTTGNAI